MIRFSFSVVSFCLVFLTACNQQGTVQQDGNRQDSAIVESTTRLDTTSQPIAEKNGLRLYFSKESPQFAEARLEQQQPLPNENTDEKSRVNFRFKVSGFELSEQTPDASSQHCANSKEGQHIHNILNNEPYTAHYKDTFSKVLKPSHYVNLSFLSRSYHESLKHATAYTLNQFVVGKGNVNQVDLNAQHMFYSRPKGEYAGTDTRRILLDFYLVNTTLSPDGNRVKATVNGTEFILTEWRPYVIEGMPLGENTIKLELLDFSENLIAGPFNNVERTITLRK